MVKKMKKIDYRTFKGYIFYSRPDRAFTKKEIKSWEKHYRAKLTQAYDPNIKFYSLVRKVI
jgi:hypothetical protein